MKTEPRDHLARCDDEEEWLVGRPSLERDEIRYRFAINSAAEAVYSLGGISEHAAFIEMSDGARNCQLYFIRRPERNSEWANAHSRKILSASARAKSRS